MQLVSVRLLPFALCLATLALASCATGTFRSHPASAPQWWKGNTHTHTLWSDGDGAPELVADWYRENGYHFLVLSDHNVLSVGEKWFPIDDRRLTAARVEELRARFGDAWVVEREDANGRSMRLKTLAELRPRFEAPGEFLFIQGEEITDDFESHPVHINGMNLVELIPPQGGASVRDTMQRNIFAVIEQGRRLGLPTLAHVNHPNYGWAITPEEIASIAGERFFEVYNGHPGVRNGGDATHASTERMWDIALTLRLTELGLGVMYGLATDDAHHYHEMKVGKSNAGRGWIMVRTTALTPEAIIGAMNRGDFYASSGVRLRDVVRDRERLAVTIDLKSNATFRTEFIGTRRTAAGLGPVGEVLHTTTDNPAVYEFTGDEVYVRARVVSSRLHPNPHAAGDYESAWVQPVLPDRR